MVQLSRKLFVYCLYLVPVTILFSRTSNNLTIALLILTWLGSQPWKINNSAKLKNNPVALISILLLAGYALSFFWTQDLYTGIKEIEVLAPLLIFPVTLAMVPQEERFLEKILKVFLYSVVAVTVLNLIVATLRTIDYGFFYKDPDSTVIYNNFFYHGFASGIGIHPSFLSIFCAFGIIILINPDYLDLRLSRFWRIFLAIILLIGMVLLQAVTIAFATIAAIVIILIIKSLESRKKLRRYIVIALVFILAFAAIVFAKFDFTDSIIAYDIESSTGWNSVNLRLALWEASFNALSHSPVWGVGIGDAQNVLLETYQEMNFFFGAYNNYQPHNQFILAWLMAGMPVALLVLLLFIFVLRSALQKRNHLYIGMIVLIILYCMTDVPLSRNKTLVFFMFFSFLFEYYGVTWSRKKALRTPGT